MIETAVGRMPNSTKNRLGEKIQKLIFQLIPKENITKKL